MAIVTKSALAKQLGISPGTVTLAIKNELLELSMRDGKAVIDTKNPTNSAQILIWKAKNKGKTGVNTENDPDKIKSHKPKLSESQKLDLEKKKLSIEKQREDLEKTRLEKRKLTGEMVPTDSIRSIFSLLGYSFQKTYKAQGENLIRELCHRAKVDPAIAAEFISRHVDVINEAHREALDVSKKSITQVVQNQKQ